VYGSQKRCGCQLLGVVEKSLSSGEQQRLAENPLLP